MAVRIQRKRTKGWRMPEGAVYVVRPTKSGNPFPISRLLDILRHALCRPRPMMMSEWLRLMRERKLGVK